MTGYRPLAQSLRLDDAMLIDDPRAWTEDQALYRIKHQYVAGLISLRDLERRAEIIMKGRGAK